MIRQPAVAGSFYTASPSALSADVARYLASSHPPQLALGVICPHAGLMYSGHVAGAVLSRVTIPHTVILVGPNHAGLGPTISVFPEGTWQIPGGAVQIDDWLARAILSRCPHAQADTLAHQPEHCLEVQLPFLHHLRPDIRIVPILVGAARQDLCRDLGRCLAEILEEETPRSATSSRPLLLASTDLSHYEPDGVTRAKDHYALDAITRLNPEELSRAVQTHRITMCGLTPTLVVLHGLLLLGATRASLVQYATSGEVSGELDRVVGYAGFIIT